MENHAVLKKYLERKKKSVPTFSMRSLAKTLDLSPSFLSQVFSGQKPLPYDLLFKLKTLLDIEDEVFAGLKAAYGDTPRPETTSPPKKSTDSSFAGWELTEESSVRVLRQWFYLPILEFITLSQFNGTAAQISDKLGISKTAAEVALSELISLGLIEVNNGQYKKANVRMRWGSAKSLAEIRNFHDQMLSKAQDTLRHHNDDAEFQRRLITGITLSAQPEKIEAAKRKLAECLHEIANDLTAAPGTEVYHLSAQLFPLTKK